MFVRFVSGAIATLLLPLLFLRAVYDRRWARSLPERLGRGNWDAIRASGTHTPVWIHAASVGEVSGIAPLVPLVAERAGEILMTTTSLTGKGEVLRRELAGKVALLPLDHPSVIGAVIDRIRPRLVVIAETEIWPNFLFALKKRNIPVVLVNARISDRTFRRYYQLRSFFRHALETFAKILAQSELDRERFVAIGAMREQLLVTGSTKYDQPPAAERNTEERVKWGLDRDAPVFIAGSVRSKELATVLDAYLMAQKTVPQLQLIIAPRHPESFAIAGEELGRRGIEFHRRSVRVQPDRTASVVLVDTIGELRRAYAMSDLAFVGGTLVPIGGHNLLEPAACGLPVLSGPYTFNMRGVAEALMRAGGLIECRDASQLSEVIVQLLSDRTKYEHAARGAYDVWKSCTGATDRVMAEIATFLPPLPIEIDQRQQALS